MENYVSIGSVAISVSYKQQWATRHIIGLDPDEDAIINEINS